MSYLTERERSISRKSVEKETPARSRELPRDKYASERRSTDTDINSLLHQLREGPVRMIDAVIAELQHQREASWGKRTYAARNDRVRQTKSNDHGLNPDHERKLGQFCQAGRTRHERTGRGNR
jgi:hypothetical protein